MFFGWWFATMVCDFDEHDDTGFFESELSCFGELRVETPEIDFGEVQVGQTETATVWVTNESNCEAPIESVALDVGDGSFNVPPITASMIPAFDAISFEVEFTPTEAGARADFLTLSIGGEFPTELDIELYGEGVDGVLSVESSALDFESVPLGCEAERTLMLTNLGNADLTITALSLDQAEFTVETQWGDPLPLTIDAGRANTLLLRYTPVDEGADLGTLLISSSDLSQPEVAVDLSGAGEVPSLTTERFTQVANGKSDILLAVSTSEGMSAYNEVLDAALDDFVAELLDSGADYHVGLVTQDDGCIAGPVAAVDNTMNARYGSALLSAMLYAGDAVPVNALNTLELMRLALDPANTAGCNAAFYREDATLALVGVINGPDQSPLSAADYTTAFTGLDSGVVVHTIGGPYPNGCDLVPVSERLIDVTLQTGGEVFSICEADWSGALTRIAGLSVQDVRRFTLSAAPIPSTLAVRVDGAESTAWTYDGAANAVVFDAGAAPPDGATVEIDYAPDASCE